MGSAYSTCCCSRNNRVSAGKHGNGKGAPSAKPIGLQVKPFHLPVSEDGHISCTDLYNMMNEGDKFSRYIHSPLYLLVLDTRTMADYTQHHVETAFHSTAVTSAIITQNLHNFSHVVLYGDSTSLEDNEHAQRAVNILQQDRVEYKILEGGYTEFLSRFPFLCNTTVVWARTERERKLLTYPSLILEDWLYQGTGDQARSETIVSALGITHILNISTEHECDVPGVKYLAIRLHDDGNSKLIDYFEEIFEFLDGVRRTNGKALVHCNLGISRSSTASMSYIMLSKCCTLLDAYTCVSQRRRCCAPNRSFFLQLGRFEEYIFGRKYTDAAELWLSI